MVQNNDTGIVELLDRALNKGVILNADLIITVADVPLLAANIKLALASVKTMMDYGIIGDWFSPAVLERGNKQVKYIEVRRAIEEQNIAHLQA